MALVYTAEATYTRPANTTAYAQGDAVSNSATVPTALTFNVEFPQNSWQWIVGVRVTDSIVATTAANFRLWIISGTEPPSDTGAAFDDNAALALTDAAINGSTNKLQCVFALDTAYSTGLAERYEQWTPPIPVQVGASGKLYGILSTNNAYQSSANSNTITVELIMEADVR
jgi:hypothetical protein